MMHTKGRVTVQGNAWEVTMDHSGLYWLRAVL